MIYAAQPRATDSVLTVGAYDNKPLVPIRAFENHDALLVELDRIWQGGDGYNLIRVTRKQVEKWFGKTFCIREDGTICTEYDA